MIKSAVKKYIYEIADKFDCEFGIIDKEDNVLFCSAREKENKQLDVDNYLLSEIVIDRKPYRIFIEKVDNGEGILAVLKEVLQRLQKDKDNVNGIREYCIGKSDNTDFLKGKSCKWVMFVVKYYAYDEVDTLNIIKNIFPKENVFDDDNQHVVVVYKVSNKDNIDLELKQMIDILAEEYITNITIGVSNEKDNLLLLREAYWEALKSIEVGDKLFLDRQILKFDDLILERYMTDIPKDMLYIEDKYSNEECVKCLKENIKVIKSMFQNNLNISETSRKMFVHRNTLLYRIDKIKKITGLDLTNFEDAVKLKIVMIANRLNQ